MRIVRHGPAPLLDQDLTEIGTFEVSTPQTRRAAVNELRRLEQVAATRRRRVLLTLHGRAQLDRRGVRRRPAALVGHGGRRWPACSASSCVARVSVRAMRRSLDARFDAINTGSKEKTVFLARKDLKATAAEGEAGATPAVEAAKTGGLWDPVPDHHADLRVQAAGAPDRTHHRPVRPRRHLLGSAARPGDRRPAARSRRRSRASEPEEQEARAASA